MIDKTGARPVAPNATSSAQPAARTEAVAASKPAPASAPAAKTTSEFRAGSQNASDYAAFRRSTYTNQDARAVLAWLKPMNPEMTVRDAQEYIGMKIRQGTEDVLSSRGITTGNFDSHELSALFKQSKYTDQNAQAVLHKLAPDNPGMTLQDAREYIGLKVRNGSESLLGEWGISPSSSKDDAAMRAFRQSSYSKEDAKAVLAELLPDNPGMTLRDAQNYIGQKIQNGAESWLEEKGITPEKWDNHECAAAFKASKYNDDDARKVLKWLLPDNPGMRLSDAREYIGLKLVNGTEDVLHEAGIRPPNAGTA